VYLGTIRKVTTSSPNTMVIFGFASLCCPPFPNPKKETFESGEKHKVNKRNEGMFAVSRKEKSEGERKKEARSEYFCVLSQLLSSSKSNPHSWTTSAQEREEEKRKKGRGAGEKKRMQEKKEADLSAEVSRSLDFAFFFFFFWVCFLFVCCTKEEKEKLCKCCIRKKQQIMTKWWNSPPYLSQDLLKSTRWPFLVGLAVFGYLVVAKVVPNAGKNPSHQLLSFFPSISSCSPSHDLLFSPLFSDPSQSSEFFLHAPPFLLLSDLFFFFFSPSFRVPKDGR
jgi:hypothetical protein